MKKRFRLVDRRERGFYCLDNENGKRFSLKTQTRREAEEIVFAKNQAMRQPTLNRQIAKAYLSGIDPGTSTRTWQTAFNWAWYSLIRFLASRRSCASVKS